MFAGDASTNASAGSAGLSLSSLAGMPPITGKKSTLSSLGDLPVLPGMKQKTAAEQQPAAYDKPLLRADSPASSDEDDELTSTTRRFKPKQEVPKQVRAQRTELQSPSLSNEEHFIPVFGL
jgi:hypothetical protein